MIQRQGSPESERQTGISYDTLNKWRKEAGIAPIGRSYDGETKQRAVELFSEIGVYETSHFQYALNHKTGQNLTVYRLLFLLCLVDHVA